VVVHHIRFGGEDLMYRILSYRCRDQGSQAPLGIFVWLAYFVILHVVLNAEDRGSQILG
jgi:hypothetical protein